MIIDEHGIIVQGNEDPNYADGGDSISRNGLMAMTGDLFFIKTIPLFAVDGNKVCRHPFQPQWRDPTLMSRDQITCYAAGVKAYMDVPAYLGTKYTFEALSGLREVSSIVYAMNNYASHWFINKDFLLPNVRLALYKSVDLKAPWYIRLTGYPWQIISMLWAAYIRPDEEQNQTIAVCSIYGDAYVRWFYKHHPSLLANLKSYWSGVPFRDQDPIYQSLRAYLESK